MGFRRLFAALHDLIIGFSASFIAGYMLGYTVETRINIGIAFCFLHTSVSLLVGGQQTLGEKLFRIQSVSNADMTFQIGKGLLNNAIFCFFIYAMASSRGVLDFVLKIALFTSVYSWVFVKNKYGLSMSGIDYLLKTSQKKLA